MKPVLPTDPALPHLAHALDPHAMAATFANELGGMEVLACEVDRIKYRPRHNVSVSYRLQLRDLRGGRTFEQRVAARFCSGGDAARRHRQALGREPLASAAGPALSHLPALDMLAHWLPNDAKLAALRLLCNESDMRQHALPDVVAALTQGRGQLVDHRTTLVQVVPELRVCARVELWLARGCGTVSLHTLYAKADLEGDGATTQAVMRALHQSAAQAQGLLRTPQPLFWQAATGLHWQTGVTGRTLQEVDPAIGPGASIRVGRALAALHATPVPGSRTVSAQGLREQVRRAAALLAGVEPAWQPLLERLVKRLDAGTASMARQPLATLHGDLHARNILVSEGEAEGAGEGEGLDQEVAVGRVVPPFTFIDLDGVLAGPATLELGAWVADALYRATLAGKAPSEAAPSWSAFLAAYAQASGQRADPALLAWSTAHDLLCKRACRCVSNLKPGRFESVPQLLALADAISHAGHVDAARRAGTRNAAAPVATVASVEPA